MSTANNPKNRKKVPSQPNRDEKSNSLEELLENERKINSKCAFPHCKTSTTNISLICQFCRLQFCPVHNLPEIHGCGDAVRRFERDKFVHPPLNVSRAEHDKAKVKLTVKLKQMQNARTSNNKKGKK